MVESEPAETRKSWEFEARKVLLVGGQVSFEDAGGYRISLDNLMGSVEMNSPAEAQIIVTADSFGRRDQAVEFGEARLLGKLAGGLNLTLSAGSMLDLCVRTPALDSGPWEGELNLAMSLTTLLALLPPALHLPLITATGEARLSVTGRFDRQTAALHLQSFELHTDPVTLR
jgi:hypothetical protein